MIDLTFVHVHFSQMFCILKKQLILKARVIMNTY